VQINHLILGAYQTNCYILRQDKTAKDCLIIDTGLQAEALIYFLKEYELNPVAVVLTHGHPDHIAGLAVLQKEYRRLKVYIHKLDAKMLTEAESNVLPFVGGLLDIKPADSLLEDGCVIKPAGIKLKVLHTPGHTPGGISLYSDDGIVFTGDTLFAGSIGRTDMTGGNMIELIKSIRKKLLKLPDETIVYPGHGEPTTIAQEKLHNSYLQ
jgi:glyoxylase-like metal-dependent hydrolase (beta-lactamase superfamily II)